MRKLLLVSTAALGLTSAYGQTTFQKTFGGTWIDYGYSLQQTNDNGFIITGTTGDVYLVKTSSDGALQWTKTFGGGIMDEGHSVQQTSDNGYIITGLTNSFGNGFDVYLLKTTSSGNLQWSETYDNSGDEYGESVSQTNDGGYIITGSTNFGTGNRDVYLAKTTSDGTLQWTKTYGGTNNDEGLFVRKTNDGGFIITGYTESFGVGYKSSVYLMKTASDGTLQWSKAFRDTNDYKGRCVQQTSDNGFIIVGTTWLAPGNSDVCLLKTSSNGSLQWSKTFGGSSYDYGGYVQQTNDGGFVIAGHIYGYGTETLNAYLVKTTSNGTLQWSNSFGGTNYDYGLSVQQTNDGGYITGGYTKSFGAGGDDIYLIKSDSNGNSGCNETSPNTIVNTPAIIVTTPITQVSSGGVAGIPSTQTDSGGVETTLCTTLSVNENNLTDKFVNIYPNPFSTQTVLQTGQTFQDASLTVYNSFGQAVKQIDNLSGQTIIFYRDNLPSGLYFVQMTEQNKIIAVDKLVIVD